MISSLNAMPDPSELNSVSIISVSIVSAKISSMFVNLSEFMPITLASVVASTGWLVAGTLSISKVVAIQGVRYHKQ